MPEWVIFRATALSRNTPARFGDWGADRASRLPKPRLDQDRERPGYLCGPRVGGLAASSPAVLGDRRCWFSGEEICSAGKIGSKRYACAYCQQNRAEIPRVIRVMRVATHATSGKRCGSSRISSIFAGWSWLQGKRPHLAIRDKSNPEKSGAQHYCRTHGIL